jgi:hypothetical protein
MNAEVDVNLLVMWEMCKLASLGIAVINFSGYKHYKNTES